MLTVPQTRKWFTAQILDQSPDAKIEWILPLKRRKFPTGLVAVYGHAYVTAPGFAPRTMVVSSTKYGVSAY